MQDSLTVLDNGLRLHVKKAPLHSVAVSAVVGYGSLNEFEHPETSGSAHFLEHMLFKGTTNRSCKQILSEARDFGIYQNASTEYDNIAYLTLSSKAGFDVAVSLLSDMVRNSVLPAEELEKERGAIIGEIMQDADDPDQILSQYMMRALFGNRPPSLPIAGTLESVKRISRERLLDIYKSSHTPDNMVLIAYGNLDKKHAVRKLTGAFGDFEGKASFKKAYFDIPRPRAIEKTLERKEISQANARMAFLVPNGNTKNIYGRKMKEALVSLSDILDNRLMDTVREKRGLVYSIYSKIEIIPSFGTFWIEFGCKPSDVEIIRSLCADEIQKLRDGELERSEFIKSKQYRSWVNGLILDKPRDYVDWYGIYAAEYTALPNPRSFNEIKLEDVVDAADRYLDTDKAVNILMVPKK